MTTAPTGNRPDTTDMHVVHRVFRRESGLLPRLVRAVPAGDVARARLVAGHLRDYAAGLHVHHTGEDELIWPLLLSRVDLEAELVLRMEAQHGVVASTLKQIDALLPGWERRADLAGGERLAIVLDSHREALLEHLGDEERLVLPLIEEHLTVAEYGRLAEHGVSQMPTDKRLFFLGALLEEASPADAALILRTVPAPGRLLWQAVGRRNYAKRTAALRAPLG